MEATSLKTRLHRGDSEFRRDDAWNMGLRKARQVQAVLLGFRLPVLPGVVLQVP